MPWENFQGLAAAIWNYDGDTSYHLSLCVGDLVVIIEKLEGWYRGYLYHYPSKKGIFPASYVQSVDYNIISAKEEEYTVPFIDPVALEAKESLLTWKEKLFESYTKSRHDYVRILNYMEDVLTTRSTLIHSIHSNVTHDKLQAIRTRLSAKIDLVNNLCEQPLSPRDDTGHSIDPTVTSFGSLYSTHCQRQSEIDRKVPHTGWDPKKSKDTGALMDHHLYLVVRNIDHQFPENSELFMFLYDSVSRKQVSERFLINVPKDRPTNVMKSHYCIFKDLGAKEMQSGIFLVCQVIRKGKMLLDDRKNVSHATFRRPYAVGVLDLRTALEETNKEQPDDDDDYQMTYTMSLQICLTHEQDFPTLHTSMIKKLVGSKPSSTKQSGILISMQLRFIRGDFQQLKNDFPYLINKNTVQVDKLGFPDVILPGKDRNDIYFTLEYGQYEKGSKRAERNVEVAIAVCGRDGRIIPRCITVAAGAENVSEYESFIYYHNNLPKWQETIKLDIPFEEISSCHLRIGFRHVAKNEGKDKMEKTFAFAHMRIMMGDGAIIPDGTHELFVYKADSKKWHDPKYYLAFESAKEICIQGVLPAKTSARGKTISTVSEGHSAARSERETLFVSTLTCSTKLTQNVNMLQLLKWRSQHPSDLPTILCKLVSIKGEEIIKFLQDILDSLFNILGSNEQYYGEPVFNALVSILNLLSHEKYSHFVPVLDIYITKHFSAGHVYRTLLWYFKEQLKNRDITKQSNLTSLAEAIGFLFHFIVQSYTIMSNQKDQRFYQGLDDCFISMYELMRLPESRFCGIHAVQAALLCNIPSILPHLITVYDRRQIAGVLAKLIDSSQNDHISLPGEKMNFIISVLDSDIKLLDPQESRSSLLPTIIGHLISHMENKMPENGYRSDDRGNSGCLLCISKVLELLHSGDKLHISFSDTEIATPLLRPLLSLCAKLKDTNNPLRVQAYINLIGLLDVMSDSHYSIYFDSLKAVTEKDKRNSAGRESMLKEFITSLLEVLETLFAGPVCSPKWVYLLLEQNIILMRVVKNISTTMFSSFFDDRDFNPQIWDIFFGTCKSFSIQRCLQLEAYSDLLSAKLLRQFGDVRVKMAKQMAAMWEFLQEKKSNFIPNFIGIFLEVSLLKEKDLREVMIPLIFDILKFEQKSNRNFKRIETEIFEKMDFLVSKGYGDEAYRDLFHDCMILLCKDTHELKESGEAFVNTVSRLIGLILDYRRVEGDSSQSGQRMGCILNLLNFYKEIDREEIYVRYIYKLAGLHESDGNFAEAGLTLLLHAKTLEWSLEFEPAVEGKYPVHTARERKEILFSESIRLLDQGKAWEYGIPLCKELATVYETQQFKYDKLSQILRTQADFFHKIINELRVENEYFVVGYFGRGFPLFLRNKIFIHRGQPYERLQNFIKKLQDEFVTAQVYMKPEPPSDDIKNSNGMHLQVRKVLPIPDEREEFNGRQIPDKIADYYKTNDVCKFRFDRPFHKGKKDPECEFATLWLERTYYKTASSFPGVINSFEVCEMKTDELNPLAIARETVRSKVQEIQKMTTELSSNSQMSINPLSMLLKGVIDAAVMGGISNYDKIFFQPKYIQDHPEEKEGVEELRSLIVEQVEVLKQALGLHGHRVSTDLKAFHLDLEIRFETFQDIVFPERRKTPTIARRGTTITSSRPLPPTPPDESPQLSQTKTPHRRLTGGNPNRVSQLVENNTPNPKVRRSNTTKGPRSSILSTASFSSPASSPDRQSIIVEPPATNSSSSIGSSQRDSGVTIEDTEIEEDRGTYEVVDFETQRHYQDKLQQYNSTPSNTPPSYPLTGNPHPLAPTPSGSSAPPPNYPAPKPEVTSHGYALIDPLDDDDEYDYEKVNIGTRRIDARSGSIRNPDFASPNILRGLPPKSRSRSRSPPQNVGRGSGSRSGTNPSPLSTSPNEGRMGVLDYPSRPTNKSPSPGSHSSGGGEPVLEDLQSVRERLRRQAQDSVDYECGLTNKHPTTIQHQTSGHVPSAQHVPNNAHHTRSNMSSVSSSRNELTMSGGPISSTPQSSYSQSGGGASFSTYDHLDVVMGGANDDLEVAGIYSYAEEPPVVFERETSISPTKQMSPPKPRPYSPRKSPTPPDTAPAPPVPRKKSFKTPDYTMTPISKSKECGAGSAGLPSIPPKAPVPRPRSQTMAADRKSQNYSAAGVPVPNPMPPNPTPRKPSYPIPSADTDLTSSSSFPSSSSSGLFSPPPRPPKPTNKDGASDPALPPALPPKMKQEAPALPPKPSKNYPIVTPRTKPPPPTPK
ncbi:PREDICTED: dedicator of cytokinesis protein 2-like isoform X2 [Amphimedon queenslandica]|uniref:Dedicator of cytokinesis protein 1 n=1 Tax=Amphimedon queenslandica TaxID=400682 RepID=A0AAN0J4S8_AMPQE|nr:PREDICTED: dedicator of cytokinesis protein 2-like isoform X2 [Amphimedon queenslandica]|eukprot:XP_019851718.1 PREDICTED: dedicator of cytokinesis protein 2-like isoform X2 [Amphimedon queenslandica]